MILTHCRMFNFGKPKTPGDWIVHIAGPLAIFPCLVDASVIRPVKASRTPSAGLMSDIGIFINYRDPSGPTVVNRVRDSKVTLVLNTPNLNVRDNQTGGCLRVK